QPSLSPSAANAHGASVGSNSRSVAFGLTQGWAFNQVSKCLTSQALILAITHIGPGNLLCLEGPDDPGWIACDQAAGWHTHFRLHQRHCRQATFRSDLGIIQHDCVDSDERLLTDPATVKYRAVTDRRATADDTVRSGGGVQAATVLDAAVA